MAVWYDTVMIVLLLVCLGLCFGSFVNALVFRLRKGKDWVRERSECLQCHHTLAPKDLIPVVSWLLLEGKCRYCKAPIPDSPFTELIVPLLFVVSYLGWPLPLTGPGLFQFVVWLVFLVGFVALGVYDLRWFLLPDKIVFPLFWLAVVQAATLEVWTGDWVALASAFGTALMLSGLFFGLFIVSKGKWIGFGDVKLAVVLGLVVGEPLKGLLLLFVASVSGALVALPLALTGRAGRKTKLPFGPLLILGTIVAVLWGTRVLDWYLSLLAV